MQRTMCFPPPRLEERHAAQVKGLAGDSEELRAQAAQTEKQLQHLHSELEAQKEANVRSPSNTMKSLVERLKAQLAQKEKQLKVHLVPRHYCRFTANTSAVPALSSARI